VAIFSSGGHALLDWPEIVLRLGVATLAGGLIGLNRDLHGKPIGLKTLV
jgi:putative Mg2+ transporter-C (MgtC) family protein